METQLKRLVNQMEVFKKVYKKKEDGQWSSSRAEEVAEAFLRLLDGRQRQEPSSEEPTSSSQASVAQKEQQLWMSAASGQKRGRVFSLDFKANNMIAGPSQPSSSTAPTPSPPQLESPDLGDQVHMIEQYIRSRDSNWPNRLVPRPPANPPAPNGDNDDDMFVYIDDILNASKNMKDHIKHLEIFCYACHREGLVLSQKKVTIAVNEIEFLEIFIDETWIFIKDLAKYKKDFQPLLKEMEAQS
ncbi:UNVERIFIED_CONTAM: Polyprotein P3 [Sesamum calycinum]|uniref:Polyprotein P3 n=1 Tax=Sesamum calycinum TaxID=2727403 RepID=A0AAW2RCL6_9LAMI